MYIGDIEKITMRYRENLIKKGKAVNLENPDKLTLEQLQALTEKIFSMINEIDCAMGYPYHDPGVRRPQSISEQEQYELFMEFLDWYQVIDTPSMDILKYVTQNYPVKKYPKILCVGDGKNCHLGRKLAMEGYKVISVDPVARKEFSGKAKTENGQEAGSLRILKKEFKKESTDMINWASVIVGSKVPECVEDLIQIDSRPTVFNISNNPEIYNMKFNGVPITSKEQFIKEISKCSGVQVKEVRKDPLQNSHKVIFVRDERQRTH